MSRWTTVAGVLTIDCIATNNVSPFIGHARKDLNQDIEKTIKAALGEQYDYDSHDGNFPTSIVPAGSEGSLKYYFNPISVDDDYCGIEAGQVVIYGNLRDYGDDESDIIKIIDWINSGIQTLLTNNIWIRAAALSINDGQKIIMGRIDTLKNNLIQSEYSIED